jgi:hypothetical protein
MTTDVTVAVAALEDVNVPRHGAMLVERPARVKGGQRSKLVETIIDGHDGGVVAVHGRSSTCLRRCFGGRAFAHNDLP